MSRPRDLTGWRCPDQLDVLEILRPEDRGDAAPPEDDGELTAP